MSRTIDECREVATKYSTRIEFKRGANTVYQYARGKGWLDDICGHMTSLRGQSRTLEECLDVAKMYNSRIEFKKGNTTCYNYACGKGWLDDICGHMTPLQESRTIEECREIAKKYTSRIDLSRFESKIYYYARGKGWLDDICGHMTSIFVLNRSKDDCHKLALEYSRPIDFLRAQPAAYKKAQVEGWLTDIFSHMKYFNPISNMVYAWKVKDTMIWKIGISNEFCIFDRIKKVSTLHSLEIDNMLCKRVDDARKHERKLLLLGTKVDTLNRYTGWSEFRKLSENEELQLKTFFIGDC